MNTYYQIWVEIDEIDESRDHYETVSEPFPAAVTSTLEAAVALAEEIADGGPVVWSAEDVREVRPDLDAVQASNVLRMVEEKHDATIGINFDILELYAGRLYPTDQEGGNHET